VSFPFGRYDVIACCAVAWGKGKLWLECRRIPLHLLTKFKLGRIVKFFRAPLEYHCTCTCTSVQFFLSIYGGEKKKKNAEKRIENHCSSQEEDCGLRKRPTTRSPPSFFFSFLLSELDCVMVRYPPRALPYWRFHSGEIRCIVNSQSSVACQVIIKYSRGRIEIRRANFGLVHV